MAMLHCQAVLSLPQGRAALLQGGIAHSALRLAFHDAIGFSIHGMGGGADGSILVFNATETAFRKIDDITARQFPVFQETGLSAGDLMASNFFGRPPPLAPAPDLTVPEPTDSATAIIERFADAGFAVPEIIALLASHTIAAATIPGTPFDSDTQVFLEVLLKGSLFPGNGSQPGEVLSPLAGEMRLQSDFLLARDSRTACLWQESVNNQKHVTTVFKQAMAKLQVLGQNTKKLIDCSEIVPTSAPFTSDIKFPASFSQADVEISYNKPFPSLATVAGLAPTVAPV
ncbi:heme peroxidase [Phlegmacium glaucopus]|nr:heme peroxidase [Phlegmacium glaucopus]